jgi:nucleoside diphosphate kinase
MLFNKSRDYQSLIKDIIKSMSLLAREINDSEDTELLNKRIHLLKGDPMVSTDKQVLKNLESVESDLNQLLTNVKVGKNLHSLKVNLREITDYMKDPLYGSYFPIFEKQKRTPFEIAETNIRLKLKELDDLVNEGIKESQYLQQQAKEMFKEMQTLGSKSLRFKQLHMQMSSIDKNNKRTESKMKVFYTSQENYRFLLDLVLTVKQSGVEENTVKGKEILTAIKHLSENTNVSSSEFRQVADKLAIYVKQVTEKVMVDETLISNLSEHVFDKVIEIDTSSPYMASEEEDQEILEKIKAQFPMLEDE